MGNAEAGEVETAGRLFVEGSDFLRVVINSLLTKHLYPYFQNRLKHH